MAITHIDHIAIAVHSIEDVRDFYERSLGLKITDIEEIKERGIRTAFIPIGEVKIELIEPLHESSEISKFLEKRGPGIHHVAFHSKSINDTQKKLEKNNIKLTYEKPQSGAHNTLVNFIHPKSSKGVLLEIVEKNS